MIMRGKKRAALAALGLCRRRLWWSGLRYIKRHTGVPSLHYIYPNTNNIVLDKLKLLVPFMKGQ